MPDTSDILRLRILLCFYKAGDEGCTVTGLAKTLGVEKYTVSRMLTVMEKEFLVDRTEIRHPVLTEKGKAEAMRYSERIDTALSHLMYEGVDMESAKSDAFYWALYNTDRTMEVISGLEERYRIKYKLRGKPFFNGSVLCRMLKDGMYSFPFLFYGERIEKGSNLFIRNEDFEQPCMLVVKNGEGMVQIRLADGTGVSKDLGSSNHEKIKAMFYYDNETFISAEFIGSVLSVPASALNFVNIGNGAGQILHGSVRVKIIFSADTEQRSERMAIFTILI